MKVSWQVTGIRHDPFAEANRILLEEQKPIEKIGTYLHPKAFGLTENAGEFYTERQKLQTDLKTRQEKHRAARQQIGSAIER